MFVTLKCEVHHSCASPEENSALNLLDRRHETINRSDERMGYVKIYITATCQRNT